MKHPLKVGFDLDGVLLYNPARILRPIAAQFSRIRRKEKSTSFYIPKNPLSKYIWGLLHKTSIMVAPGFSTLIKLVKEGKIEAYIVTGRYGFLRKDFESWLKKMNAPMYFKNVHLNETDTQPHEFKSKMIKKLGLDVFVEDNWDIVQKLKSDRSKAKIFWITNILDLHHAHDFKFLSFRKAMRRLAELSSH